MRTDEQLLAGVNRSGFPLQLGIERLIATTQDVAALWEIRYREHHWRHAGSQREGFLDLVLSHEKGVAEIVMECKRVQDTAWTFLHEVGSPETTSTRGLVSINRPKRKVLGWNDLDVKLSSPESEFCVIIGDKENPRPMLERLSATAVESAEALAAEDVQYAFPHVQRSPMRVYFAVIVTTAALKMCEYKPGSLNVASGTLSDAVISDVPFIRFRKQLSATQSTIAQTVGVKPYMVSRAKESTVFVVNVNGLLKFLRYYWVDDAKLLDVHDGHARTQMGL